MATAHLLTHNADWLSTFAEAWRRRARPIRLQWQKEGKYNEELFFRCSRQHFAQTEKSVLFDFHWSPKYCCRQITGTLFTLFFHTKNLRSSNIRIVHAVTTTVPLEGNIKKSKHRTTTTISVFVRNKIGKQKNP